MRLLQFRLQENLPPKFNLRECILTHARRLYVIIKQGKFREAIKVETAVKAISNRENYVGIHEDIEIQPSGHKDALKPPLSLAEDACMENAYRVKS
ncbi:hypothetical protein WA026_017134 [Henosepilachna vigintioctopunctata]|uniref:Uncharacterized protein n=1 Tax=Henosepilachna vigintioctopunctata TaxID=420089 RepID=A0AAW1TUG4_9CUCU